MPFNTLSWINRKYNSNLSFTTNSQVLSFSILWNIFEREKCNNNFTVQNIASFLRQKDLSSILSETNSMLTCFRNRYISNGQGNSRFQSLNLRNPDNPQLVKDVLFDTTNDDVSKVLCITIIIYRFRNNLFHGLKVLTELTSQEPIFEKINHYLATLIDNL